MIITFTIHWKYKVKKIITFYLKLNTEFFTFHGGYLLNTKLYVSGVGFSVVGLDRKKKPGFYRFQSFWFIAVIVISILPTITCWEASIQNQSVQKILYRPLNTFKFWYEWGFSHIIHWVHYLFQADKSILYENDDYVIVTGDSGKKSEFPKQNQTCNFPANCPDAPPLRYWRIMEANTINPLNSKIKIWILSCCPSSFPTEVVGRSW